MIERARWIVEEGGSRGVAKECNCAGSEVKILLNLRREGEGGAEVVPMLS